MEYLFPIGVVDDIDQNIIEKIDLGTIVTILTINKSAKLRMIIYNNMNDILDNRKYSKSQWNNLYYKLFKLREVHMFKKIDITTNLKYLSSKIDVSESNKEEVIDFYKIINDDDYQDFIIKFTKKIIPEFNDVDDIVDLYHSMKYVNFLVDVALKSENTIMHQRIKKWYNDFKFNKLYKQLSLLNDKL
jgi:hypothetical protein